MRNKKSNSLEGHVVDNFFVHYDKEGKVYLISNVEDQTLNNFSISIALIPNFISGYKDCTKYNIDYFFNISKGLIYDTVETAEELTRSETFLYQLPNEDLSFYDIAVEHDISNSCWHVNLMPHAIERLSIVGPTSFYICKRNNPYFLISQLDVNYSDLTNGCIKFSFNSEMEYKLSDLSVFTIKRFKTYCVKENNEKN